MNDSIVIVEFEQKYIEGVKKVVHTVMSALRPDYKPKDPRNADLDNVDDIYGGKGKFWVAKDGDRVIGTVAIQEKTPQKANVKRLFLLPEYRGKGIGKMLLLHALNHCRRQNFQEVTLITSTYAADAQRLFQHVGFQKTDKTFDFDKTLVHYRLSLKI